MRVLILLLTSSIQLMGAEAKTENFVVTARDQKLANDVAASAEGFRRHLGVYWLGKELPPWQSRARVNVVRVGPTVGANGQCDFQFVGTGRPPVRIVMEVSGSRERILDSVIPHEVNHTVFASHFGRPLPRWFDEGAASAFEHDAEKAIPTARVRSTVGTQQWIPFRNLISRLDYPRGREAMLQSYAQGHLVVRYLLERKDPGTLLRLGQQQTGQDWNASLQELYGIRSVDELDRLSQQWLRAGFPAGGSAGPSEVAESSADSGDRLVLFTTKYCESCKQVYPLMRSLRESGTNVEVLDLEQEDDKAVATRYEVTTLPTVLVVRNGKVTSRLVGARPILQGLRPTVSRYRPASQTGFPPGYQDQSFTAAPQRGGSVPDVLPASSIPVQFDWKGVRIVAIASNDIPAIVRYLRGPIERLVTSATNGRVLLEVVSEGKTPRRLKAVELATGLNSSVVPLQFLILVDRTAEVGFVKGQILKRIEAAVAEKTRALELAVPIEVVFERTHGAKHWAPIMKALQIQEPSLPAAAKSPAEPAVEKAADDRGFIHKVVAFLFALLTGSGSFRGGHGLWQFMREKIHD